MLAYSVINMQMIWPLELPLNLLHCTLKTTDIYFRSILQILLLHSIHYWYYEIFKYVGHSMLERLFWEKKMFNQTPTSKSWKYFISNEKSSATSSENCLEAPRDLGCLKTKMKIFWWGKLEKMCEIKKFF